MSAFRVPQTDIRTAGNTRSMLFINEIKARTKFAYTKPFVAAMKRHEIKILFQNHE